MLGLAAVTNSNPKKANKIIKKRFNTSTDFIQEYEILCIDVLLIIKFNVGNLFKNTFEVSSSTLKIFIIII